MGAFVRYSPVMRTGVYNKTRAGWWGDLAFGDVDGMVCLVLKPFRFAW